MEKKEFLRVAIILPICLGLILSIVFFAFFKINSDLLKPVSDGTVFSYHNEQVQAKDEVVKPKNDFELSDFNKNDNLGTITFGTSAVTIRYDADYSNLVSSVSLMPQSNKPGDVGCAYIYAFENNITSSYNKEAVIIDGVFGSHMFKVIDEFDAKSEDDVLKYAPDESRALVVYYQATGGSGLTSKYKAIVYGEVA